MGTPPAYAAPGTLLWSPSWSTKTNSSSSSQSFAAGQGTYVSSTTGDIHASVAGPVATDRQTIRVVSAKASANAVPAVNSIVTGRVTRVTPKQVDVSILCIGDLTSQSIQSKFAFKGVLRKERVRAFEVDTVDVPASFRPGDLIRARVAALGGARTYDLTTAANDLGVIHALSAVSGEPMEPVGWESMRDPVSGKLETRKVAKPTGGAA